MVTNVLVSKYSQLLLPKRTLVASPYSSADSVFHPISLLDGEKICSLVVTIFSSLVFVTTIFRMFASSKEKDLI